MPTTRSARLFATEVVSYSEANPRAAGEVYVSPGGAITLFKSALVRNVSGGQLSVLCYLQTTAGVTAIVFSADMATDAHAEWQGWHVLEPTDSIWFYSVGGPYSVWGSGAVLQVP